MCAEKILELVQQKLQNGNLVWELDGFVLLRFEGRDWGSKREVILRAKMSLNLKQIRDSATNTKLTNLLAVLTYFFFLTSLS